MHRDTPSVTVHLHLHCKSLVQKAESLHSNDVLQKPAWLPTPLQSPTWSPTERKDECCRAESGDDVRSTYTRSPVGYSQCCCRTRWCRPHCQCRTKWVLRAAASVCRPQGISVWRCHPLGNRNDRSVTHTNGKLVQNLQYTRRTLIRHNRCQCSWSEQLAHLKKVQNCSVSCASINHLQTLNSP